MYKYIQSRFYRSPEVLLGLPYDTSIDMWSFGCILVEMHTGLPLFDGKNELDQMHKIIQVLGMPPQQMIERSPKKDRFFMWDSSSGIYRLSNPSIKPACRTLSDIIGVTTGGPEGRRVNQNGHSPQDYIQFHDLVKRILQFVPGDRLLPYEGLQHDFFRMNGSTTMTTQSGDLITTTQGGRSSIVSDSVSASPLSPTLIQQASLQQQPILMQQPMYYTNNQSSTGSTGNVYPNNGVFYQQPPQQNNYYRAQI